MGDDAAQQIITSWRNSMTAGRTLPMMRSDGLACQCRLQMDHDITTVTYVAGRDRRQFSLDDISQITIGEEIPEEVNLPVNECCVTLVLWDGEAVAFQFDDVEGRDTFALCLGMFVDQRRQATEEEEEEWYEEGAGGAEDYAAPDVPAAPTYVPAAASSSAPRAAGGGQAHAYVSQDFWKPTWCDDCKNFLNGWAKQGQACPACRRVVCHGCAAKGGRCPGAPGDGAGGYPGSAPQAAAAPPPISAGASSPKQPSSDGSPGSHRSGGAPPGGGKAAGGGKDGSLNDGQKIIKKFVQKMVRGRELSMLSKAGGSVECLVHLDRELKNIFIQRAGRKDAKKRAVPLGGVQEICVGQEVGQDVELPVDDMSVTLLLEEGQAIAFRLDDTEDRDTFALCMGMFVDGNRKEAERKARKR